MIVPVQNKCTFVISQSALLHRFHKNQNGSLFSLFYKYCTSFKQLSFFYFTTIASITRKPISYFFLTTIASISRTLMYLCFLYSTTIVSIKKNKKTSLCFPKKMYLCFLSFIYNYCIHLKKKIIFVFKKKTKCIFVFSFFFFFFFFFIYRVCINFKNKMYLCFLYFIHNYCINLKNKKVIFVFFIL